MNKFPIGFWNYARTSQLGPESVKDWSDLGMTLAMSPSYDPRRDKKKDMIAILDECEKHGIQVILCDSRIGWAGAVSDPAEYEARFTACCEDFGHHPAVFGFHIGDEPWSKEAFEDCIAANRIQCKIAPHLTPFLNFLPYWEGMEKDVLHANTFEEWAVRMTRDSGLKQLCYDHYAQLNPEESGTDGYYKNLHKFSDASKAAGLPLWTTLLSVGHFRYRQPTEDDFRWQLNSAAACGCKGILWFFIYMREPTSNYRLSPIDEFWERTESFARLSRVNRHFLKQYGDFFMNAEHLATYMIGKSYGDYPLFTDTISPLISSVTCDQDLPGVVSLFQKDGERYLCIVNNSPFASGMFKTRYRKEIQIIERLNWNGPSDVRHDHWDAYFAETETEVICGDWYAPGQMQIYRFK